MIAIASPLCLNGWWEGCVPVPLVVSSGFPLQFCRFATEEETDWPRLVLTFRLRSERMAPSGRVVFSDLELVEAFNQLLVEWTDPGPDDCLCFPFRNLLRAPETELHFQLAIPPSRAGPNLNSDLPI